MVSNAFHEWLRSRFNTLTLEWHFSFKNAFYTVCPCACLSCSRWGNNRPGRLPSESAMTGLNWVIPACNISGRQCLKGVVVEMDLKVLCVFEPWVGGDIQCCSTCLAQAILHLKSRALVGIREAMHLRLWLAWCAASAVYAVVPAIEDDTTCLFPEDQPLGKAYRHRRVSLQKVLADMIWNRMPHYIG